MNRVMTALFACCCLLTSFSSLNAQNAPAKKGLSEAQIKLAKSFNRGKTAASPEAQKALGAYVQQLLVELVNPANEPTYATRRKQLFTDIIFTSRSKEARGIVVSKIVRIASFVVKDAKKQFRPAARINCASILAH